MSEGQVFLSRGAPNLTLRIHGKAFEFRNGRHPVKANATVTDEGDIAKLKSHPDYGKAFITEEDEAERKRKVAEASAMSPKEEAALVASAMKALEHIPGVTPSALTVSPHQEVKPPESGTLTVRKSQEQSSEQSEPVPSLTAVSRMKKKPLLALGVRLGVEDLNEQDTVPILRRKVKSFIKQNA